jgi:hypothetical protein
MIIDRLADELGEDDAVYLEQHLADCAACRADARELSALLSATRASEGSVSDAAMENRLVGEMRRRYPQGGGRDRAPAPLLQRARTTGWARLLTPLMTLITRPLPGYAAFSLVLIAVTGGFWLGKSGGAEMRFGEVRGTTGGRAVEVAPAGQPDGGAIRQGAAPLTQPRDITDSQLASFAISLPSSSSACNLGFVAVRSDAIQQPVPVFADSL